MRFELMSGNTEVSGSNTVMLGSHATYLTFLGLVGAGVDVSGDRGCGVLCGQDLSILTTLSLALMEDSGWHGRHRPVFVADHPSTPPRL